MSIFSVETWRDARERVAYGVSGHTERMYNRKEIGPGDRMLCWITGLSRVVGVQRVTTSAYEQHAENDRIWDDGLFPIRFGAELEVRVPLAEGVSLDEIRAHSEDPTRWRFLYRNPGHRVPEVDASWITQRLKGQEVQLGASDPEPGETQEGGGALEPSLPEVSPPPGSATPPSVSTTVVRRVRDTRVSRWVKRAHDGVCQVCGERLTLQGGWYAEGAHIKPLGAPHLGPDVPSNVLCLCPNDHVRFDSGSIVVEPDGNIHAAGSTKVLGQLRRDVRHVINSEYLEYRKMLVL